MTLHPKSQPLSAMWKDIIYLLFFGIFWIFQITLCLDWCAFMCIVSFFFFLSFLRAVDLRCLPSFSHNYRGAITLGRASKELSSDGQVRDNSLSSEAKASSSGDLKERGKKERIEICFSYRLPLPLPSLSQSPSTLPTHTHTHTDA